MKASTSIWIVLLTAAPGLSRDTAADDRGSYSYLMVTAADSTVISYRIEPGQETVIRYHKKKETEISFLRPDMANRRWEWTDPDNDTDIAAERDGNRIVIKGRFQGKPIDRVAKVADVPWYQNPGFNLPLFIRSGSSEIRYIVLRPQDLKDFVMCGKKEGTESIVLGSGSVEALALKVTICGWMSRLWSARYWFRESDGLYLAYRGVQGPPGTPETVVRLIGTNE